MELPEIEKLEDLEKTHKDYNENIDFWKFMELSYEGGPKLLDQVITRNERESSKNYQQRLDDAVLFNYSEAIVDLFSFYLNDKEVERQYGKIKDDPLFKKFYKNADLQGTNYEEFINELQKASSVTGSVGLLVDKPNSVYRTRADHELHGIYPYCAVYTLPNILDWIIDKDPATGKPVLMYLKLLESDGTYYIWYRDRWQRWAKTDKGAIELIEHDVNPIGEIPFWWVQNLKVLTKPQHGKSDISAIAYIVGSIARNFSSGDEVIKYAGFPILQSPKTLDYGEGDSEQEIGVRSVLEFNPEDGVGGKHEWLENKMAPINAILDWTDRKVDEIYRIAHLSGVHGQRRSNNEVASGLALRYEFQQLTAVMQKKAKNITETEMNIWYYWLAWQKQSAYFDSIEIKRTKDYNIEDLSVAIENTLKTIGKVRSPKFVKEAEKKLVRQELPNLSDEDQLEIFNEIENLKEKEDTNMMQFKNASNLEGSK
jgi:hypothetical protein